MKRANIQINGTTLTFYQAGGTAPQFSASAQSFWPYLLSCDLEAGDSASGVHIRLNNDVNCASRLLGFPPKAPIELYDEDNALVFKGSISRVDYGPTMNIEAEAEALVLC